jgi:hypothetical protein
MAQATACRAVIYGFNSHPQLHSSTLVPKPICISLKGTSTNPKRIDIYNVEKIFQTALIRLQTSTEMPQEDKTKIQEFVDHLFVKEIGKLRVVMMSGQLQTDQSLKAPQAHRKAQGGGIWPADNQSQQVWTAIQASIANCGSKLDIVYDEPTPGGLEFVFYSLVLFCVFLTRVRRGFGFGD